MPEVLLPTYDTAANAVNLLAAEMNLVSPAPTTDPFQSTNSAIAKLTSLLRSTGQILQTMHEWQGLEVVFDLETKAGDTGVYPLPADFSAFTDQTGWQKSYFWPLRGPYSAQRWQRIINYPTTGIYVAFRIQNNQFWLWPQPPPVGIGVTFVYKSLHWCADSTGATGKLFPTVGTDIIGFDWLLFTRFLKLRYLQSIGHDTAAATEEFKLVFDAKTAQADGAAPELFLARNFHFPYLTGFNEPDTGYGGQPEAGDSYM